LPEYSQARHLGDAVVGFPGVFSVQNFILRIAGDMGEEGLSFFDIPWDVRYSSIYNELDCVDFSRLAATSKRMKVDALEDANWVRLLQSIKKSASWDRWLNQLTQRTWNFHPRLLYAVLKVILTHKSTTMSYVRASSTNGSVLLKNGTIFHPRTPPVENDEPSNLLNIKLSLQRWSIPWFIWRKSSRFQRTCRYFSFCSHICDMVLVFT
jgi:hypothetical protein